MNRAVVISAILSIIVLISSCKTSNNVADNGWMQKRKYRSGLHLNLGKAKTAIKSGIPADKPEQEPDSVIASIYATEVEGKWWQSADGVEPLWLVGSSKLSENKFHSKDELEPKLETVAPKKRFGQGKHDTNLARKLRAKLVKPIEPSDDPERDGLISIILLALFFAGLMSLPIVNLVGSIFGLIYGIKAKRGGEEDLGTIGVIGNAVALGLSILYSLILLLYLVYILLVILVGLGLIL